MYFLPDIYDNIEDSISDKLMMALYFKILQTNCMINQISLMPENWQ